MDRQCDVIITIIVLLIIIIFITSHCLSIKLRSHSSSRQSCGMNLCCSHAYQNESECGRVFNLD